MRALFFINVSTAFVGILGCSKPTERNDKHEVIEKDSNPIVEIRNPGSKSGLPSGNPNDGSGKLQLVDLHFDKGTRLNFSKIKLSVDSLIVRFANSKEIKLTYDQPKELFVHSAKGDLKTESNILSFEINAKLTLIPIDSIKLVLANAGVVDIFDFESGQAQTKTILDGTFEGRPEKPNTNFSNSKDFKINVNLPDLSQESSTTKIDATFEEGKPIELWQNSTVECHDSTKLENLECKYFDEIIGIFSKFCKGKPNPDTGKVGFNNFSVGNPCQTK